MKPVYEASKCHTLDRYDWMAQKDSCGIGEGDIWDNAVLQNFTLDHYPYVKGSADVAECMKYMSINSP